MQNVVGIRFRDTGKIYDFDSGGLELKTWDLVIVDSEKGPVIGKVVVIKEACEIDVPQPLRKIVRKALEEDIKRIEENEVLKKETSEFCRSRIKEMGLAMRLVGTELSFDGSKAIFYFTSEGRVDFREIVKDLAAKFKIRIEMKQIGVRDEARLIGGYGCCGRALCCETFIKDFEPVSIRMAKKQELALNPVKISGVCGRLMCCLIFEYEIYDEIKKDTNELKSIERSLCPEAAQTSLSSIEPGNSYRSSTPITKVEEPKNISTVSSKVAPASNLSSLPDRERNGIGEGLPATSNIKRKRRRRRRRRRPEGSSHPDSQSGEKSPS